MAQVHADPVSDKGAERRLRIERLLARYPALAEAEQDELLHWFEREASALDVALVASGPRAGPGYQRFKAERIDRLGTKDVIRAVGFLSAFGAAILGVAWLAD